MRGRRALIKMRIRKERWIMERRLLQLQLKLRRCDAAIETSARELQDAGEECGKLCSIYSSPTGGFLQCGGRVCE